MRGRSGNGKLGGGAPEWSRGSNRQNPESRFVPFYFGHRGETFTALSEFSMPRAFQN